MLLIGYRYARHVNYEEVRQSLNLDIGRQYGIRIYLPLMVLMLATRLLPTVVPNLGMPLIFVICSILGMFTGKRFNALTVVRGAMNTTIPVLGKLMGVGMFIQVMTLTGVHGYIVINRLSLGPALLYLAICTVMPAFGAVSRI